MKNSLVQPYLFFGGRCEEALEFYKHALGAEVTMLMRFNESPDPVPADMLVPGFENKVMHAEVRIGASTIMASDGCGEEDGFGGFSLSLISKTEEEAQNAFEALSRDGKVSMPLGKTFWSPCFGMLEDRFGIGWMVNVVSG